MSISKGLLHPNYKLWLDVQDVFDAIGAAGVRKLSALALCTLITLPLPPLLDCLDLILGAVTAVWFEVPAATTSTTLMTHKQEMAEILACLCANEELVCFFKPTAGKCLGS